MQGPGLPEKRPIGRRDQTWEGRGVWLGQYSDLGCKRGTRDRGEARFERRGGAARLVVRTMGAILEESSSAGMKESRRRRTSWRLLPIFRTDKRGL